MDNVLEVIETLKGVIQRLEDYRQAGVTVNPAKFEKEIKEALKQADEIRLTLEKVKTTIE